MGVAVAAAAAPSMGPPSFNGGRVLTREASCVWLDANGSLIFNAKQCRTLAAWLNERADEMEAK